VRSVLERERVEFWVSSSRANGGAHVGPAPPEDPKPGWFWFNTLDMHLYVFTGEPPDEWKKTSPNW